MITEKSISDLKLSGTLGCKALIAFRNIQRRAKALPDSVVVKIDKSMSSFDKFLDYVGMPKSTREKIQRKDKSLGYIAGNVYWETSESKKPKRKTLEQKTNECWRRLVARRGIAAKDAQGEYSYEEFVRVVGIAPSYNHRLKAESGVYDVNKFKWEALQHTPTSKDAPVRLYARGLRANAVLKEVTINVMRQGSVKLLRYYGYDLHKGGSCACFTVELTSMCKIKHGWQNWAEIPFVTLEGMNDDSLTTLEFPDFTGFRIHSISGLDRLYIAVVKPKRRLN